MALIWADECNGVAGSPPDPAKWGLSSWAPDGELQAYTTSTANAYHDGKCLVIKAIKQVSGAKQYTSARLMSRNATQPGRFATGLVAARIKVPAGGGVWPAFWLLGDDNLSESAWPRCGEIDVMEATTAPSLAGLVHQGTHSPAVSDPGRDIAVGISPTLGEWDSTFHVYSARWTADEVRFYVDEWPTGRVARGDVEAAGGVWQFAHRQLGLVLNVAVGGWGGGAPDPGWTEQSMLVDWVRVYAL
jgi:beta-glucanase (GH16 family)